MDAPGWGCPVSLIVRETVVRCPFVKTWHKDPLNFTVIVNNSSHSRPVFGRNLVS